MGEVINFQNWVNMKAEEQKRLKKLSVLADKTSMVRGLIYNIHNSIGVSIVTKYFNEVNQLAGREHIIDDGICNVILESLDQYIKSLEEEVQKLHECV